MFASPASGETGGLCCGKLARILDLAQSTPRAAIFCCQAETVVLQAGITERLPTHVRHIHNAPRHLRACQGMGAAHFGDHRFAEVHVFNLSRRAVNREGRGQGREPAAPSGFKKTMVQPSDNVLARFFKKKMVHVQRSSRSATWSSESDQTEHVTGPATRSPWAPIVNQPHEPCGPLAHVSWCRVGHGSGVV